MCDMHALINTAEIICDPNSEPQRITDHEGFEDTPYLLVRGIPGCNH